MSERVTDGDAEEIIADFICEAGPDGQGGQMKRLLFVVLFAALLTGCGGGSAPGAPKPGNGPLDPQGNWLFTFTGQQSTLKIAGQLYELHPPAVTSNGMPVVGDPNSCVGTITFNGQASGTNTISGSLQIVNGASTASYSMTGTIAADEKSMSGTFSSTNTGGCTIDTTGTWSASLLAPVTGNWVGTGDGGQAISASLSENTDQTSPNMGAVTGTLTLGGGCFTGPLTLASDSVHFAEILSINAGPDANGASVSAVFNGFPEMVNPAATQITDLHLAVHGGTCDGQTITVTLTR